MISIGCPWRNGRGLEGLFLSLLLLRDFSVERLDRLKDLRADHGVVGQAILCNFLRTILHGLRRRSWTAERGSTLD